MKSKRTIIGTLLTLGLAVGLSFNTNVRNYVTGSGEPDTIVVAHLESLLVLEIRRLEARVALLSKEVQELATLVALEPLPAVFVVEEDGAVVPADSARARWVWKVWRPLPEEERR